ncbi:MAG: tetratricopeptide repeat protein, partial [Elusimicrobiota bacterium]
AEAIASRDRGDAEASLRHAEAAVRADPADPMGYFQRGRSRAELKDHNGAIADFSQAMAKGWTDALLFKLRAEALFQTGRHREAVADADLAVAYDPKLAGAYLVRGLAKLGLLAKRRDLVFLNADIEKDLRTAVSIDPSLKGVLARVWAASKASGNAGKLGPDGEGDQVGLGAGVGAPADAAVTSEPTGGFRWFGVIGILGAVIGGCVMAFVLILRRKAASRAVLPALLFAGILVLPAGRPSAYEGEPDDATLREWGRIFRSGSEPEKEAIENASKAWCAHLLEIGFTPSAMTSYQDKKAAGAFAQMNPVEKARFYAESEEVLAMAEPQRLAKEVEAARDDPSKTPEERAAVEEKAKARVEENIVRYPKSSFVHAAAAEFAFKTGDFEAGMAAADRSVDLAQEQGNRRALSHALVSRGNGLLGAGEFGRALADAESALKSNPRSAAAFALKMLSQGRASRGQGFSGAGAGASGAAVSGRSAASVSGPAAGAGNRSVLTASAGYSGAVGHIRQAETAMRMGDWEAVIRNASAALAQAPGNGRALMQRALARTRTGEHQGALDDAAEGLKAAPGAAPLLAVKAAALNGLGRAEEAAAVSEECLAAGQEHPACLFQRGLALRKLGRPQEVFLADLRKAAASDPSLVPALEEILRDFAVGSTGAGGPAGAGSGTGRSGSGAEEDDRSSALGWGLAGGVLLAGLGAVCLRRRRD